MDISMKAPFSAYKGKEPYIFISYAHKNAEIVYPYLMELNSLGYRVWYDEGIEPGAEWPESIAAAIDDCSCMVVFISPEAVNSQNVRNEINFALNKRKMMLCIHIKETVLPRGLELQLGSIQAILEHRIQSKERFREQMLASLPPETKEDSLPAESERKLKSSHKNTGLKTAFTVAVPLAAVALLALAAGLTRLFGIIPAGAGGLPSTSPSATSAGAGIMTESPRNSSMTVESPRNSSSTVTSTSPDDSFDGTVIDTGKWTVSGTGAAQDGRLALSNRDGKDASVTSTWQFLGDFDFQADFELGDGWGKNDQGTQTNMIDLEFGDYPVRMCNEYIFGFTSTERRIDMINDQGVAAVEFVNASKGTFRVSRTGNQITLAYDIGKGWQQLYQGDIPEGHPEASVSLVNTCSNGAQGFTAYFDSFKVNSGFTSYTGK